MKLSTKSQYGLRAMCELAYRKDKDPVSVQYISKNQGISIAYLEQLLNKLRRKGLVESIRGPKGGYVLSKSSRKIRVSDVLRALEGDLSPIQCVSKQKNKSKCLRMKSCATIFVWKRLNDSIEEALSSVTLYDLCKNKGN